MYRKVNKFGYCLFCLFLGGIGAHKFYAGKNFSGLLYLFLCWTGIPILLAIIDLIIGLIKPADEYGNYFY